LQRIATNYDVEDSHELKDTLKDTDSVVDIVTNMLCHDKNENNHLQPDKNEQTEVSLCCT